LLGTLSYTIFSLRTGTHQRVDNLLVFVLCENVSHNTVSTNTIKFIRKCVKKY